MSTIKEILDCERNRDKDNIILFKEGSFWKAYEKSAYVLVKRYGFKPSKRFVKTVNEEVISVGFPSQQLLKYLSNAQVDPTRLVARALVQDTADDRAFSDWKVGIALRVPPSKAVPPRKIPMPDYLKFDPYVELPKNYYKDHLPVFRHTYALLVQLIPLVHKMSKDFRYDIGQRLVELAMQALIQIYQSDQEKDLSVKILHIDTLQQHLLEIKLYLRVLHDVNQLSVKQFANISEMLVLAEKHAANWKKNISV